MSKVTVVPRKASKHLQFKRLCGEAIIPTRAHEGDAGYDLYLLNDVGLDVGERHLASTGIAVAIPQGFVGLVTPRSGLANKFGLSVTNSPGIVDSGYRGELKVILHNLGQEPVLFRAGERVAQLVITTFYSGKSEVVSEFAGETQRDEGGFGSSGK